MRNMREVSDFFEEFLSICEARSVGDGAAAHRPVSDGLTVPVADWSVGSRLYL